MRKIWTVEENEYIIAHYPNEQSCKVAAALGRSIHAIHRHANIMKVKKSADFLASQNSGIFIKGHIKGSETRFKKGMIPFTKGKKQSEYLTPNAIENSKKTRFKKGNVPVNTKKNGDIVIRRNKNTGQAYFIRTEINVWIPLAHKNWIDKNGNIPKGKIIRHIDGNKLNCEIENLECITKVENVIRNGIHNYPTELIPIVKLNNKLKKQIKKYEDNI